jgi:hypothetical protein
MFSQVTRIPGFFLFWRAACDFPLYELLFIPVAMALCLFILTFCCCSGSDAEDACRNRMCLLDQPSTLGAQVRFVLNLKCVYFRCTG